jgi:hypothetical protein
MKASPVKTADRYVYLADAGNGIYKIGWSRKPTERLRTLSSGGPHSLTLLHQLKTEHATWFESYLKRRFQEKRIQGEWFRLGAADVACVCGFTPEAIALLVEADTDDPHKGTQTNLRVIDPRLLDAVDDCARTERRSRNLERALQALGLWPPAASK